MPIAINGYEALPNGVYVATKSSRVGTYAVHDLLELHVFRPPTLSELKEKVMRTADEAFQSNECPVLKAWSEGKGLEFLQRLHWAAPGEHVHLFYGSTLTEAVPKIRDAASRVRPGYECLHGAVEENLIFEQGVHADILLENGRKLPRISELERLAKSGEESSVLGFCTPDYDPARFSKTVRQVYPAITGHMGELLDASETYREELATDIVENHPMFSRHPSPRITIVVIGGTQPATQTGRRD